MVSNSLASWANSSSGSGSSPFLDRLDGHGDLSVLAGVLARRELRGELAGLVDGQADERLVQARDEPAGADLVGQPLGGRPRHLLAVDGGRQVDRDEVTVGDRPVHAGQGAEPGAQRLQLGIDVLVGDGSTGSTLTCSALRSGSVDLGADVDLGGEGEVLAVLLLGDLDVGLTERVDLRFGHRLPVAGRQGLVDDLVEHRLAADPGLQQLRGCLARAEAGQPHLLGQLLVGPLELGLELGERHLHVDAHPGGAQLLDGALHGCAPRWSFRLSVGRVSGTGGRHLSG